MMTQRATIREVPANDDTPSEAVGVVVTAQAGRVEFVGQPVRLVTGVNLTAAAARAIGIGGGRIESTAAPDPPPQSDLGPPIASVADPSHIFDMADAPTRSEYDAKLAATEARLEGRLSEVRGDVRLVADKVEQVLSTVRADRAEALKAEEEAKTEGRRLAAAIHGVEIKLSALATKADLTGFRWQTVAVAVGAVGLIVGGVIGGLAWIKPDDKPTPAAPPVVITLPPQPTPAPSPSPPQ